MAAEKRARRQETRCGREREGRGAAETYLVFEAVVAREGVVAAMTRDSANDPRRCAVVKRGGAISDESSESVDSGGGENELSGSELVEVSGDGLMCGVRW